ncbi:hypothetical protein BCL57_000398 [Agromyces flavus]|uniref:Uncharacterized protein n=1 Tax=Agromyces flavus TaxID=589382 RepID=A0ABT1KH91_9MICO|nr:hypothetical protein [Agromyces flavus]MCP2366256.1 hypothetical protein [Agromyces flavus]GGI44310.1 hypothetical protein GCM10010932_03970 [Agromyces flavus]
MDQTTVFSSDAPPPPLHAARPIVITLIAPAASRRLVIEFARRIAPHLFRRWSFAGTSGTQYFVYRTQEGQARVQELVERVPQNAVAP